MLTRFLLAAGQADQASKVAGFASARGRTPAATAIYAEALLQSRQFDAAEEQRKRLEQMDPENPLIANLRARLILGRSKPAEAATALEKAYLDLAKEKNPHAEQFGREVFPMLLGLGPNAQGVAEELASRLAQQNPALSWMRAPILARRGKRAEGARPLPDRGRGRKGSCRLPRGLPDCARSRRCIPLRDHDLETGRRDPRSGAATHARGR